MIDNPLDSFMDKAFSGFYRGVVVNNNDPKRLGRVQIKHYLYENVPTDKLPWALRLLPTFPQSKGQFSVPNVGDEVVFMLLDQSLYTPAYFAHMTVTPWGHSTSEYPDDWGLLDRHGNSFTVSPKTKQEAVWIHQSGSKLIFDKEGNIILIPKPGKTVKVDGKLLVTKQATFQEDVAMEKGLNVTNNVTIGGKMSAGSCCCSGLVPQLTTAPCT